RRAAARSGRQLRGRVLVVAVPRSDSALPADRGDPVAAAGAARARRGKNRMRKGAVVGLMLLLVAAPFFLKPYGIYLLTLWVVMTIAAIGLNLTLGYAGQISLAQGAFVGIGAYAAALLTTAGWPLWSAFLLAIALSLAIGWLLGYPALRVQHHYLAFVT